MGRNEIIKQLSKRIFGNTLESNIKMCALFCDTLEDIFKDALIEEKKIMWRNFLSLEIIELGERSGRDLNTGELRKFPPVKTVNCKVSKAIKELINEE